ncbi:glycoside hydrolase superfamily [Paraphoma chrysanthemicola]|uniref:Beta-mannosidase B n=1 Tax=Paraphoma chrysanthemicola TaxID=798071 RepID=A0A8K0QUI0_9PLEO|nr:glycoside hydrolase superfamily [Paraphoma chrysanthemicola]
MAANNNISSTSTQLNSKWTFKQGDRNSKEEYLPANDLPTEVHRDLLKNEKVKDPFQDLNELSVRWVADKIWTYRTVFATPTDYGKHNTLAYLKFEGLDTFVTVWLNGDVILVADNMFVQHEVIVAGKLQAEGNVLELVFEPAKKKGLEVVKEHDEHRFIVHQTETSRGPVRKAQYHWGWDWGPILLTCGPWKPISIETYECRISDLSVSYMLGSDLKSAKVTAKATSTGPLRRATLTVASKESNHIVSQKVVKIDANGNDAALDVTLDLNDIELWWPRGYGAQALYQIRLDAYFGANKSEADQTLTKTVGLRKVELIKEPDAHGTSFYFRVNDMDIFIGGSCWIPADSFLTRITAEQYRAWVQLVADGNQTMLRVWGGGIYESDAFFEAADELGILVWQDFAFACANYPAYPNYLKSVEKEARQNVRRLRHHPSLVIWAGNNEDYQIVERYGLKYDVDDHDPQSWLKTDFPARYIYEHLLPKIVDEESFGTPYHPSSPFGDGKSTTLKVDPTVGDVHQWNVWHGTMEPYQRLPEMGGRFVSEFGMEAYPHVSTLERCITSEENRYPGSMAMDFRNKAIGHERRLVSYVAENFRIKYDLEGFTHLTQVIQADAMSWSYKAWRRQWGSPGKRTCGGILVWQLNDCWPTISWAIVDYHLVPKPAYYAIKRAMQPVTVSVQRKYKPWTKRPSDSLWQRETGHIEMNDLWQNPEFDVWIANGTEKKIKGEIRLTCYSVATGELIHSTSQEIVNAPNTSTAFLENTVLPFEANAMGEGGRAGGFVTHAKLYVDGECVSNDTAWPEPIKYLSFENRGVEVAYSDDKSRVFVTAQRPVKGFVFSERQGTRLSDNGFDVMPGERKEVIVTGGTADGLKWLYVGI